MPEFVSLCLNVHASSLVLVSSSVHRLSFYLIKHPRDALEVIGFSTRGKGHGAGICQCVHELA